MPNLEQQEIETIVLGWAKAVSAGDRDGILAHHAPDLLMFDFPNTVRGIEAYDKTWDFFFDKPRGPITYAPTNLDITTGQDVAFVTCEVHCDGTSAGSLDFRLTVGLERQDGQWVITHEHHSMPTTEERFIEQ
ncbi:nuclear transport factor 2 family protein [Mesorhizobium sp. YR577]|uniref:YybH family protein n=1 Tax=Mesorhizobium sp. YR577 TaxID=1884373 RepID=UPI0008E9255D|nr:nuclear transport factor 2 family protein [Mesorhizobium sp. YR577]SFU16230.1 Ketosteroid isomerase homolog [Mesorhizobium sp. YR577]